MRGLAAGLLAVWVGLAAAQGPTDGSKELGLGDLAAYRAALDGRPEGPAVAASFRDLWDDPGRYQGKRVRVEGRVARRFRQGAFGTFPPLVEAWAFSTAGDTLCLVFPDGEPNEAGPGATVRFEGIFLRTIRYQGGDAPRLAPLIVGHRPPTVIRPATPPRPPGVFGGPTQGWIFGMLAAALLGLALARRHLRASPRRPSRKDDRHEPPPEFIEHRAEG